jgi:hypothetical protein
LLLVRREWRAAGAAAAIGVGWYVAGFTATQGNWIWPIDYAHMIGGYFVEDFSRYAIAGMTLPAMLMRAGITPMAASIAGLLLLAIGLSYVRRTPVLEAASMTGLLALAASPHAWGYDAALVLPSLFFAMTVLHEPVRTRVMVVAYVLAALQVFMTIEFAFNPLAIVVLGGTLWWLAARSVSQHTAIETPLLPT